MHSCGSFKDCGDQQQGLHTVGEAEVGDLLHHLSDERGAPRVAVQDLQAARASGRHGPAAQEPPLLFPEACRGKWMVVQGCAGALVRGGCRQCLWVTVHQCKVLGGELRGRWRHGLGAARQGAGTGAAGVPASSNSCKGGSQSPAGTASRVARWRTS